MSSQSARCLGVVPAVVLLFSTVLLAGPTFRPDTIFNGSSLAGWHVLGQAYWKAQNGEIVGTMKPSGSGGWLVLDKAYQDVGFYASFRCPAGCRTGVLLRAEKTPQGMKGVYVSLTEGDQVSYRVTLDAQGRVLQREKLTFPTISLPAPKPGQKPVQPAPPPASSIPAGLEKLPWAVYNPGAWNTINIVAAWTEITPDLNGGGLGAPYFPGSEGVTGGTVTDADGKYGPIALYVGGSGEVRFKDIAWADLNARQFPKETVSRNFIGQRLSEWYYSYAAAAGDIDHDGTMDVVAGPYWYAGPDYTVAKEIYQATSFNPMTDWPIPAMSQFAYDWNGDGWADVLGIAGNAGAGIGTLYLNPKGESRRWDKYPVLPSVGNETTVFTDIDGDGKPELIHGTQTLYLTYSKPDASDATKPWITQIISGPGPWGANAGHGIGVGDINGDRLMDYVNCYGWWEQPAKASPQALWTYHPQAFGRWGKSSGGAGGAEIGVYDVNGDGLNDVVTALEGHGFGLGWYEQKRDGTGKISFVHHIIMDNFTTKNAGNVIFTEPHGTAYADMDRDGVPDIIVAKSPEHHHGWTFDPDPYGPPVLYWYRTVRNPKVPGGAEFVPELIHNRSGVGDHFWIGDLNKDNRPDVVTSGAMGTFIFFNQIKRTPAP